MKKKPVLIINGPNLNLLGTRQPEIYGSKTFEEYLEELRHLYSDDAELMYFQSNSEGAIIDYIQDNVSKVSGIVINAGAYTHTSVAIHDALANVSIPKVEVHISNIHKREVFRQHSYLSSVCDGIIVGMGLMGYELALQFLIKRL